MNSRRPRILVVDDEPDTVDFVETYLADEGYETVRAYDGEEMLEVFFHDTAQAAGRGRIDLVVMDVVMPGIDGFEACRRIRKESSVPIIMLTARGEHVDRIVGLELGADDYLAKPFDPRELVARIRAVLRRTEAGEAASHGPGSDALEHNGIRLDPARREVTRGADPIELTAREFDLLHFLMKHPGRVFSRDQLIERVWDADSLVGTRTVDVHVRRLREQIEPDPSDPVYIETVWAVGYRFADKL